MTEKKPTKLRFDALSEGLGFHPFSEGLPYSPVSRRVVPNPRSGTGAVSAGPASVSRSILDPHVPSLRESRLSSAVAIAANAAVTAGLEMDRGIPGTAYQFPEQTYGYGYVVKRFAGYLLDTAFNLALCAGVLSFALWNQSVPLNTLLSPGLKVMLLFFALGFSWVLVLAQEIVFGTSFGKRIFGLGVHGSLTATFMRAVLYLFSVGFFGLGILYALVDKKRRCLHDLLTKLQPIEVARLS
ncbi:RDD family protein [bacterium]|nr:RDD family protein [bacterium]